MAKQKLSDRYLSEVIEIPGLRDSDFGIRRCDLFAAMMAAGHTRQTADLFAFGPSAQAVGLPAHTLASVIIRDMQDGTFRGIGAYDLAPAA